MAYEMIYQKAKEFEINFKKNVSDMFDEISKDKSKISNRNIDSVKIKMFAYENATPYEKTYMIYFSKDGICFECEFNVFEGLTKEDALDYIFIYFQKRFADVINNFIKIDDNINLVDN